MRRNGRITEWNDDRGFGFITPNDGGGRVFVHVKAFARGSVRPAAGMHVAYALLRDGKGRCNAVRVRIADQAPGRESDAGRARPGTWIGVLFLAVLVLGWLFAKVPASVVLAYGAMSIVAIVLYGRDKSAARNTRWRTRERTLHLVGLLGGWPGALFAQEAFRHKSRKVAFQMVFRGTVALNCAGLAWLLASGKAAAIHQVILAATTGG